MLLLCCIMLLNLLPLLIYMIKKETIKSTANYQKLIEKLDRRIKVIVLINSIITFALLYVYLL
ncbi:hypothetical protein SKL01_13220 [Staphylococcus kloosii]|uniref:G-protein coupled receptors family 1 profile domain-containing protein n=1 Tax=Staphylococcus kloosii TaxID=29384 RepID=A0ABQ0XQF8_9STAP|nr:hypothetical protein SKL01_13220 [Staphylococcus kloosii]